MRKILRIFCWLVTIQGSNISIFMLFSVRVPQMWPIWYHKIPYASKLYSTHDQNEHEWNIRTRAVWYISHLHSLIINYCPRFLNYMLHLKYYINHKLPNSCVKPVQHTVDEVIVCLFTTHLPPPSCFNCPI